MIHSARPTFSPVAITIHTWNLFVLRDFKKVGMDKQTRRMKIVITTGRDWVGLVDHLMSSA